MKKIIYMLIVLLIIEGCNKKEEIVDTTVQTVDINITVEEPSFLKRHWGKIAIGTAVVIVGAAVIAEKKFKVPIKSTATKIGKQITKSSIKNAQKLGSLSTNLIHRVAPSIAQLSAKKINFNKESLIKNIPNKIGVYMVKLEGSKNINYVGRAIENREGQATSGLRKRLFEHLRSGKFGKGATVAFKECDTAEACKQLEAILIKGFNPSMNKRFETIK